MSLQLGDHVVGFFFPHKNRFSSFGVFTEQHAAYIFSIKHFISWAPAGLSEHPSLRLLISTVEELVTSLQDNQIIQSGVHEEFSE